MVIVEISDQLLGYCGLPVGPSITSTGVACNRPRRSKKSFCNSEPIIKDRRAVPILEDLIKTNNFLAVAKSLPDINLAKGQAFLEKNGKRKGVFTLESGLQYEVLTKGSGISPKSEDKVEVHYHGTLIDGEVFDSSIDRGEPTSFQVDGVIKGWTEALQLMKQGAKWKLFIPADIAYGETGSNSIGPNETLIFEVELLNANVGSEG